MRFRNVSGDTQDLPTLDLRVGPGGEFDVTGDDAKGLVGNPAFTSAASKTKTTTRQAAVTGTAETPQTAAHTDTKDVS